MDSPEGLVLETKISNGEHFVDNEDIWINMSGDGESESGVHATGIALDGGIYEILDLGKLDDLVELASDVHALHPHDGALEEDVLPSGEVGVESRSDLDEHPHATGYLTDSAVWAEDLREKLENGRLACPVGTHDSEGVPHADVERNIPDGPEFLLAERGAHVGPHKVPRDRWDQVAEAVVHLPSAKFLPHSVKPNTSRH